MFVFSFQDKSSLSLHLSRTLKHTALLKWFGMIDLSASNSSCSIFTVPALVSNVSLITRFLCIKFDLMYLNYRYAITTSLTTANHPDQSTWSVINMIKVINNLDVFFDAFFLYVCINAHWHLIHIGRLDTFFLTWWNWCWVGFFFFKLTFLFSKDTLDWSKATMFKLGLGDMT